MSPRASVLRPSGAADWPTLVDLDVGETVETVRNGGAAHRFRLVSLEHRTMPFLRNAADGTMTYAAVAGLEIDGEPVVLTLRPYQSPVVASGLRVLLEGTRTWSADGIYGETLPRDLRLSFTGAHEPWGPSDLRFPIAAFRWHGTTYHNTWMGMVPQNEQIYYHKGEDFGAVPNLLRVLAVRDGTVSGQPHIVLRDGDGAQYGYGHMFPDHVHVAEGQAVAAGSVLAETGGYGNGDLDPHLHVQIQAPDGSPRNTFPILAEAYLRDYPDAGIAVAGGYQFMTVGQTITLDGSRSLARPGRSIRSMRWILHDGSEVAGATAAFTAVREGHFCQELRVVYDDGSEERDAAPVRVFTPGMAGQVGILGFIYQHPVRGIVPGTPVRLQHCAWNVAVTERSFDFGDGSPAVVTSDAVQEHAYAAPGLYTVTISAHGNQVLKTTVLVGDPAARR